MSKVVFIFENNGIFLIQQWEREAENMLCKYQYDSFFWQGDMNQ